MQTKLTATERSWVLYDVGNSAFTLMLSTIIPIYFNSVAEGDLSSVDYLAYWGYAASLATIVCALLGPVLGAVADRRGMKIRLFTCALAVGVVGCSLLGFVNGWLAFLAVLVITRLGYSLSLVFYDSMLVDVTTAGNMHRVSASGYAWGYIGSCVPFVVCLVLILGCDSFGMTMGSAMTVSLVFIALWWVAATIPLLKRYRQVHYLDGPREGAFRTLAATIRNARSEKKAFMFLIAFFFFIDGVYTIIEMATAYGQAIGLDSTMLLVALLVTQIVAFPCTLIFGRVAGDGNTLRLLAGVTPDEVSRSLSDMRKYNELLLCPGRLKRRLVERKLRQTGNYDDMIGLVLNLEGDPRCDGTNSELMGLYDECVELAVDLIQGLDAYLSGNGDLPQRFDRTFGAE